MTTGDPPLPPVTVEDIFGTGEPVRTAEDLARAGVFGTGEVEEFLADFYAMRRSDG